MSEQVIDRKKWVENMNTYGFKFRAPKNNYQNLIQLFFRDFEMGRRMLGGKWEGYVHDMGTCHAVITWHWVDDFQRLKDGPVTLFRIEDWDNARGWAV